MWSVTDFCKYAGFSRAFYYILQKRGDGPAETRIGRRVLVAKATAEAWLKSREVPAADKAA